MNEPDRNDVFLPDLSQVPTEQSLMAGAWLRHDGLHFWTDHTFLIPTISEPTQCFERPTGKTEVQRGGGTWPVSCNESQPPGLFLPH